MQTSKSQLQGRIRTAAAFLMMAGLVIGSVITTGCDDSEADETAAAILAPTSLASSSARTLAPPPTMSELTASLSLTDEQQAKLEPVVARWQAAHEERAQAMERFREARGQGRRDRGPRTGQGPRDGFGPGSGPCDGEGPGAGMGPGSRGGVGHGARLADDPDREPPFQEFLGDAAAILTPEQMVQVIDMMAGRHPQRDRQRLHQRVPGGAGMPGLGGQLRCLVGELNLTTEQQQELREVASTHAANMRDAMEAYGEDELGPEALRDRIRELRTSFESDVTGVIGEEAFATLEEKIREHQTRMAEHQLERLDDRLERQAASLDRILSLTDEQEAALASVFQTAVAQHTELLQTAGQIEIEDAVYRRITIQESTRAAIRYLLDEKQLTIFDALENMGPGHGPHGPRM